VEYLLKHHTNPAWPSLSFTEVENFLIQALYTQPQPPQHHKTLTTGIIPNDELRNVYAPEVEDSIEYFVPSQRQKVLVPRWICSSATEVFFEGDRKGVLPDLDEMGLASSTIACLQRLPKDVRAKVMQAVVVVGGGAAVPGFTTRLRNCLLSAWEENAKIVPRSKIQDEMVSGSRSLENDSASNGVSTSGKRGETFKFLAANPLEATFLGASLLGDVKVRGLVEVTREGFNSSQGRGVMDWSFVGGIGEDEVEEGKRRSRG
jgi:actin-related protein 10